MENEVEVYSGKLSGKNYFTDMIYIPHLKCFFLAINHILYRKDLNDKPAYLYMDFRCGWREDACFSYSMLHQRLLVIKEENKISILDPNTRKLCPERSPSDQSRLLSPFEHGTKFLCQTIHLRIEFIYIAFLSSSSTPDWLNDSGFHLSRKMVKSFQLLFYSLGSSPSLLPDNLTDPGRKIIQLLLNRIIQINAPLQALARNSTAISVVFFVVSSLTLTHFWRFISSSIDKELRLR